MLTLLPAHMYTGKGCPTLTTYLFRSWVITLPKFSSCSLVVMRKEGKELIIFQTWNKIIKIFYWLYWPLLFAKSQQWERWQLVQLPIGTIAIGGFVSGPHSDKATDCPLFVSRARSARSFIGSLYCHHQISSNLSDRFKESARGSSFLRQICEL